MRSGHSDDARIVMPNGIAVAAQAQLTGMFYALPACFSLSEQFKSSLMMLLGNRRAIDVIV